MKDCIFCKIIKGEAPSQDIYEDEVVKVFLDLYPDSKGHLLIVPKEHYQDVFDCPDEVLSHIAKVFKKIAKLVKEKLGADAVHIVNNSGQEAGQIVFHLHFHILPRYKDDGLRLAFHNKKELKDDLDEIKNILIS